MMITDFCICGPNLAEAEEHAQKYMGKFVESNFHHYEFLGEHFATVKGYDAYVQKAAIARQGGLEGAVAGFMQAAIWGTPDRILRELEARRGVIGDFELNAAFRFGGVPFEIAERGLKLFAKRSIAGAEDLAAENAALRSRMMSRPASSFPRKREPRDQRCGGWPGPRFRWGDEQADNPAEKPE